MTLPLRMVPFERYMLVDDRPAHPMAYTIRLLFTGRLDRAAFESAVDVAVARHPFLGAHLSGSSLNRLAWTTAPQPRPWIGYFEPGQPLKFPQAEYFDLRTETGLRVWVRGDQGEIEMRFQFHHSCCDGIGAYRFLEDLLCAYDRRLRPEGAVEFRPLDPALLRRRTRFGLSWLGLLLRVPVEFWGIVVGLAQFFFLRPVALASPEVPSCSEEELCTQLDCPARHIDPARHKALRAAAKQKGVTLNDLLMHETVIVMHEWNKRLDPSTDRKFHRLMFPVNVRSAADEAMPAANVIGMLMLDRKLHWWRGTRLLWSVQAEIRFLKLFQFGISFPRACTVVGLFPGGLAFLANPTRSLATGVFSNMGRVFHEAPLPQRDGKLSAGELLLEAVESGPPVRPFTHAAFSAVSYAGDLTLVLVYDRRHLTPRAAEDLLDMVMARVDALISGPDG